MESESNRKDKLTLGFNALNNDPNNPLGSFIKSFLLFKAFEMKVKFFDGFRKSVGKVRYSKTEIEEKSFLNENHDKTAGYIRIPGNFTAFESFRVALNHCRFRKTIDKELRIYIFVICVHNFYAFRGFRMNKP